MRDLDFLALFLPARSSFFHAQCSGVGAIIHHATPLLFLIGKAKMVAYHQALFCLLAQGNQHG
jgi:hypothetical protein